MKKQLIIVGIDPGTTIGYAILDIAGKPIKIGSIRGATHSNLINTITERGRTLVIGTDKAKIPSLIHNLSAKLGARIISPPQDLTGIEKKKLVQNQETKNSHEFDSLSSALFAFRKIKPQLEDINKGLIQKNKEELSYEIIKLLILHEGTSITDAIALVEKKGNIKQENPPTLKKPEDTSQPTREEYIFIREKLKKLSRENRVLRDKLTELSEELAELTKKEENYLEKTGSFVSNKKAYRLLKLKEKRLRRLEHQFRTLTDSNMRLKEFLGVIGKKTLLKKLPNLNYDEFLNRNKILHIQEGDIILVEDIDKYSTKTLEAIKDKVQIIIHKNQLKNDLKNSKDFLFIEAAKLDITEESDFALTDTLQLEQLRKNTDLLINIMKTYKEARKKEQH